MIKSQSPEGRDFKMNTYTSHSTLCCHWCKIPLGNATQVTYLNGNLPICDLCLSKQVTPKFTDNEKISGSVKETYERD
jgi:hypothetical protein